MVIYVCQPQGACMVSFKICCANSSSIALMLHLNLDHGEQYLTILFSFIISVNGSIGVYIWTFVRFVRAAIEERYREV